MRAHGILLVLLLACGPGCKSSGSDDSKYVQVTSNDGRTFYARRSEVEKPAGDGTVTFEDMRTKKKVTLDGGSFRTRSVSRTEVHAKRGDEIIWEEH
jgi:hypothetical protein